MQSKDTTAITKTQARKTLKDVLVECCPHGEVIEATKLGDRIRRAFNRALNKYDNQPTVESALEQVPSYFLVLKAAEWLGMSVYEKGDGDGNWLVYIDGTPKHLRPTEHGGTYVRLFKTDTEHMKAEKINAAVQSEIQKRGYVTL